MEFLDRCLIGNRPNHGGSAVKNALRKYWYIVFLLSAYGALGIVDPDRVSYALMVVWRTLESVFFIIISVFILIGLVQAWLKEDLIASRLGEGSGIRAVVASALIGSLLVGPLFAIFPLLKTLQARGARVGVIVAMLSTWAVKIPMLPLEIKFLGLEFAVIRIILVLVLAVPSSLIIERIVTAKVADNLPIQLTDK